MNLATRDFASTAVNQFSARASGGVRFITAVDGSGTPIAGVTLASGGGSWTSISDRNAKENLKDENGEAVLASIAGMPIQSWNYKTQDPSIRHMGPMAQDFYGAFGLGEDSLRINTVDIDGINLLAIQALEKRTRELRATVAELKNVNTEVAALRTENSELKAQMAQFDATLQRLVALTASLESADADETTVAQVTP